MFAHVLGVIGLCLCSGFSAFINNIKEEVSDVQSFLYAPKRLIDTSEPFGVYQFYVNDDETELTSPYGRLYRLTRWDADNGMYSDTVKDEEERPNIGYYYELYPDDNECSVTIGLCFESASYRNDFGSWLRTNYHQDSSSNLAPDGGDYPEDVAGEYWYWMSFNGSGSSSFSLKFSLGSPTYSVSASYVYCSYASASGDKYLPSSPYNSSTLSNPYFFTVNANEGCRFRKDGSAVTATGGITIDNIVYNNLNVGDYATSLTIQLRLPLGDCSITFNAINQFAVNKNLDACTTTIPDVYSVDMTGTYRIEALSGYAFDSNLTQYSITGIVVNSVAYADNIYGHLYRTIVLDLTFPATNYANVTATASPYSADYAQGFNDGEASGLELKGGLMDLIPNVFASIGAFFFTFSGVNFMGINLLAIVGIVVSVGLIGVVIKVALK